MNKPQKIIEELLIILLGLRMNILNPETIVSYADHIICSDENPDSLFIDLSLSSKNKNEMIHHLHTYIELNKTHIDQNRVLSIIKILNKEKIFNLESTVMVLYRLNNEIEIYGFERNVIYRLDDQYYLVSNKIVMQTMDELETEIFDFLSNYSEKSEILNILNC